MTNKYYTIADPAGEMYIRVYTAEEAVEQLCSCIQEHSDISKFEALEEAWEDVKRQVEEEVNTTTSIYNRDWPRVKKEVKYQLERALKENRDEHIFFYCEYLKEVEEKINELTKRK